MRASLLLALVAAFLPSAAAASPPSFAPPAFEPQLALQRSTVDRPDDNALPQIQLMYVLPSDGVDRGFDTNGTIENSTASWERWLRGQAGGKRLRLDPFGAQLDVTFVRLAKTDAQIAAQDAFVLNELEADLGALGFDKPN